jgi:sigma-B regulation protein RsbQ
MVFAHGYGCDQHMWEPLCHAFAAGYQLVLFDHVGAGESDLAAYERTKYGTLHGYAQDVLEILDELRLRNVIFVGHSVSAMIGVLAAIKRPELFHKLVLVGPSPRYINDDHYIGGFERKDIEDLLEFQETNYLGWASNLAPAIMGNPDRPELAQRLTNSFCRTDPEIAKHFAAVTFLSDNRADLPKLMTPALVLQCQQDVIAPLEVDQYVADHLLESRLVVMHASGHCPHLSAPDETIAAILDFLAR